MKKQLNKLETPAFYICCFFIYCFIGWVYEVITMYHLGFGFVNRGFLHGCYLPIYGFSALFFILIFGKTAQRKFKVRKISFTPLIIFLLVFITSSVIEYSASYILEKCFNLKLWSYNSYKYNLNGRIALESSIYFGIGGLVIFYIVQPVMQKIRKHIKPEITIACGLIISAVMISDFIITISH